MNALFKIGRDNRGLPTLLSGLDAGQILDHAKQQIQNIFFYTQCSFIHTSLYFKVDTGQQ